MSIWLQNTDANVPIINTDFIISNSNVLNRSTVNGNEGFGTKEARQKGLGYFYFEFTKIASTSSGQSIGITQNNTSFSYNAVGTRDNYSEVLRIPAPLSTTGILLDMRDSTTVRFTITSDGVTWSAWDTLNKTLSPIYIGVVLIASSSSVHLTLNTGKENFLYDISPLVQKSDNVYSFNGQKKFKLVKSGNILSSKGKLYSLLSKDKVYETKMTSNVLPSPLRSLASAESEANYAAWKAFNGFNLTAMDSWRTATNIRTGWIRLDFGIATKVSGVMLTSPNDSSAIPAMAKDFVVEGSNDTSNFTPIKSFTGQIWGINETKVYKFDSPVEYRYYRINVSKAHRLSDGSETSGTLAIGEILYFYDAPYTIRELTTPTADNFIKYGMNTIGNIEKIIDEKQYVLQDAVSENEQGLWTTQLNRKPLSIKFD
ncbi:hypothetical protein LC76P1_00129 [Lysinibacillus phage LC76P1]|nr:hypothetical protein LC76P1_00129 [Lysinibacillus phage LC76P1]